MIGATAIARNFVAHARILADSFVAAHPGGRFVVLCLDAEPGELSFPAEVDVLTGLELFGEAELNRRGYMYSTQELVSSSKPDIMRRLVHDSGEPLVFLDADSFVYGGLTDLGDLAGEHGIALSPHRLGGSNIELEGDADFRAEGQIIQAGVFNAGLLAVSSGAVPFLEWWRRRTARHAIMDVSAGFLACQTWLALVPALFPHCVLSDRGVNVMGWNLHDRDVDWVAGRPEISGRPLRHFHFCGRFDPHCPDQLSPHAHTWPGWPALNDRPGVRPLVTDYARRLLAAGYDTWLSESPRFAWLPDGQPVTPEARRRYRGELITAERSGGPEPYNPFHRA